MTDHLPECPILKPCCDDKEFPEHGFCLGFVGRCLHCMAECICDELRACEERMLNDDIPAAVFHSQKGYQIGYVAGLDAAREAVASIRGQWVFGPRIYKHDALTAIDALRGES